jgi:hypothetical protein
MASSTPPAAALLDSAQSPSGRGAVAGAEIAGAVPDEEEGPPPETAGEDERQIERGANKVGDGRLHGFRLAITL